jgi:hypothetical protein
MKKALISATLGLSVIASSLAISASANAFTLVNYKSLYTSPQECLAVAAGTPTDGTRFIVYHCDQSANQSFSTTVYDAQNPNQWPITNPTVGISSPIWDMAATYKGVSVGNNAAYDGAPVVLWSEFFTSSPGQYWTPDATYSPAWQCYRFIDPNSGNRVLGALGGSMKDGTAVVVWHDYKDPANHADQYWCVR